jgi:two-component system, NtrC family, response regulator HydG
MHRPRVIVVDDNLEMARTVAENLSQNGFDSEPLSSGAEAIARFTEAPCDAILTDLRMKDVDGLDVLEGIRRIDPGVPVIIMTAFGAIETAIEAIRRGAYHYVTKPFKLDFVRLLLERACAERGLRVENQRLRAAVDERYTFANIVGGSPRMRDLFGLLERLAAVTTPILILGETGTGKELVARALHQNGPRAARPFVAINCAAVPEALLESELFGHTRGSFTGATQPRRGLFAEAEGGTLLLDEIGDMPLPLQAKLLRVLESGEVRPVGSDTIRQCDVRILASTHRTLPDLVKEGKFREDLYFRLKVVSLRLPPLRERREDIPLLVAHFLEEARGRAPTSVVEAFDPGALALLAEHSWPGNVRELKHVVESLVIVGTRRLVDERDLRGALGPPEGEHPLDRARRDLLPLRQVEQLYIDWVLQQTGNNKTRAAEILGVDPSTLYRREVRNKT